MTEKQSNFFTSLTKEDIQSLMQAIEQGHIDGIKWRTACWFAYRVLEISDLDIFTVRKITGLSIKDVKMVQSFGDEEMLEYFGDGEILPLPYSNE